MSARDEYEKAEFEFAWEWWECESEWGVGERSDGHSSMEPHVARSPSPTTPTQTRSE